MRKKNNKQKNHNQKKYDPYPNGRYNKWAHIDDEFKNKNRRRQRDHIAYQIYLKNQVLADAEKNNYKTYNYKNNNQKNIKKKWGSINNTNNYNKSVITPKFYTPEFVLTNEKNKSYKITKKDKVCGKRKERRNILFTLGHAGVGVAGPIKKILGINSKIRCK